MPSESIDNINIKAVILAGNRDFGRCPLASNLPPALWPVIDKPVLQRLLQHFRRQGIKRAVICSNGSCRQLKRQINPVDSMNIRFLDEPFPAGTAGCLRDAANGGKNTLFLICQAAILSPPNISTLIRIHRKGKSALTVMLKPGSLNHHLNGFASEIYICEPAVLEYIPEIGFYDIKEALIPAMIRDGKNVNAAMLSRPVGNFRNRTGYLAAIADYLENGGNINSDLPTNTQNGGKNIRTADTAQIAANAQIYEPAVIMDNAVLSENAIIFGPAIIASNVRIGKNTFIENSVCWPGADIGQNCQVRNSIVACNAIVPGNSIVEDEAVIQKKSGGFRKSKFVLPIYHKAGLIPSALKTLIGNTNMKLLNRMHTDKAKSNILRAIAVAILSMAFIWLYLPQLTDLWNIWQRSDEYSSGLLVPFLAVYVLWTRRRNIKELNIQPSLWGLPAFIAAQGLRYFGMFFMYSSAERLSLVLSIAALVLFLFGWRIFYKISPILAFLCLMLPLPRTVHNAVMLPLQNLATASAVFCLEMTGYNVIREGNIIHLNGATVAVGEACNGLRMVTAFFVIVGLVVLLVRKKWWEKLIVLISALPIALLCNTVRLTITSIAFTVLDGKKWETAFHDFGGYAMMPLAMALVIFEFWFLTKLTTSPEQIK